MGLIKYLTFVLGGVDVELLLSSVKLITIAARNVVPNVKLGRQQCSQPCRMQRNISLNRLTLQQCNPSKQPTTNDQHQQPH